MDGLQQTVEYRVFPSSSGPMVARFGRGFKFGFVQPRNGRRAESKRWLGTRLVEQRYALGENFHKARGMLHKLSQRQRVVLLYAKK
jgi:hypothetical protein